MKEFYNILLVLIPKKQGTKSFKEFRTISLWNTIYKIITKTTALRLENILPKKIAEQQGGIVKGRQILDGIIKIPQILHSKERSEKEGMILKLDMNKAYGLLRHFWIEFLLNLVLIEDGGSELEIVLTILFYCSIIYSFLGLSPSIVFLHCFS